MKDQFGRKIDYLRISVTDRCNLRCKYCMPKEGVTSIGHENILTFEEIVRICRLVSSLGIRKIKLTGGEPLVRRNFSDLVRQIKEIPAIEEVTMTTNGILLEKNLSGLKDAGIDRINISLDTLKPERYREITRIGELSDVMTGIEKAISMNFKSIKINSIIMKGWNEDEIVSLASLAKKYPLSIRFIEIMPIGNGNMDDMVCQKDIMKKLTAVYGIMTPSCDTIGNGPASYYDLPEFSGKVGFISAVSHQFCDKCNRIRLTADGNLKLCLQYQNGVDLRKKLREGISDEELLEVLKESIYQKPQKHHFKNQKHFGEEETKSMFQIGG